MWNFHSGRKDFNTMKVYLTALENKYGQPKDLEDLAAKAQLMNYEAIRPMFEAFVINRPKATGVVQWMLNSPWPEFYWQLYDYYLMPTGAYYGTKKAGQPLTAIYNYFDQTIHLSNDAPAGVKNIKAELRLLDQNSKVIFEKSEVISLGSNVSRSWLKIPELKGNRQVYFLDLKIRDDRGKVLADNFYWLATEKDQLDWSQYFWFYTPQKKYADFKALNDLPAAKLEATKSVKLSDDEYEITVKLKNPSDKLAFFTELQLNNPENNKAILPVFWSDNYISLLPGEEKVLTVKCRKSNAGQKEPVVRIKGYNVTESLQL